MNCLTIAITFYTVFISVSVIAKPAAPAPPAAPAAGAPGGDAAGLPISWLVSALPRTGIVGMMDNFGAGFANFFNAQGAGFDSGLSAIGNGIGNFLSGVFGSGAINTAFLNYNNRPPADIGTPPAPPPAAGATPGGQPAVNEPPAPTDDA